MGPTLSFPSRTLFGAFIPCFWVPTLSLPPHFPPGPFWEHLSRVSGFQLSPYPLISLQDPSRSKYPVFLGSNSLPTLSFPSRIFLGAFIPCLWVPTLSLPHHFPPGPFWE